MSNETIKNMVVLGGSYAGSLAAGTLASTLPPDHKVVLVDQHSHTHREYTRLRILSTLLTVG